MEFSEIFGFMTILSKSIKLALKNAKCIAAITLLSLLTSSILFVLFCFCYETVKTFMTDSSSGFSIPRAILFFLLILSVELGFLFAYVVISHASGIATILASAASYSDTKLSLQDLYSRFKTKWNSPLRRNLRGSRNPIRFLWLFAVALAVPLVIFNPSPITITILSVAGVSLFVYQLYHSVVLALAAVMPVVDDGCEVEESMERAEKLAQGQRINGFMVNLFLNLLILMIMSGFWVIVGDKGILNLMVYGLLFVSCCSLMRIFISVVYTAYYFHCVEFHGQNVKSGYTILPADII